MIGNTKPSPTLPLSGPLQGLDNLRKRSISGAFVTIASQGVKFGLTLVSTIVLARLLTPGDFGKVAMVTGAIGLFRVFKEAGLSTATVQSERISQAQISNLFWINAGIGLGLAAVVLCIAPGIAWFYGIPELTGIGGVLSLTFLFNSMAVQHRALLKRNMRFQRLAGIEVASMMASVITGVVMAVSGAGYWSLVGAALALELCDAVFCFISANWCPSLPKREPGTRDLLKFGASLTIGDLLSALARSLDTILLGRFHGPEAVGLYTRAMALLLRPMDQLMSPITAVFVPVLSRLKSQPDRYRRSFLKVYEVIAFVGYFFSGVLFPLSIPVTLLLLGEEWIMAGKIFGGFTVAALYIPLGMATGWLLLTQGRGKEMLLSSSLVALVTTLAFLVGLPFGPLGMALAFSVSGLFIRLPLRFWFAGRSGPVTAQDLWCVFFRHLPLWAVVFTGTLLSKALVPESGTGIQVVVGASGGTVTGLAFCFAFSSQRKVLRLILECLNAFRKD